jgi:glycosyltransferase involved in cell wall biosynthesis
VNLVFVSTFEAPCGIATYTRKLADALAGLGHKPFVYAEHTSLSMAHPDRVDHVGQVTYTRSWQRGAPYDSPYGLGRVARSIRSSPVPPDVVHVQHEFGLFPRTPDLVRFAKDVGVPVVFTLHTVAEDHILGLRILAIAGRAIVHSAEGLGLLWHHPVTLVPHGATAPSRPRDKPAHVLVPGFVGPGKGTLEIVEAYWRVRTHYPDYPYPLQIAGLCRDAGYEARIRSLIARYQLDGHVSLASGYLRDDVAADLLSAAAAVVLGGGETSPYSASGQLHDAIGFGVPAIAKRVPIYQTPAGAGVLYYEDADSLATWLAAVQDERLTSFLARRQRTCAETLGWPDIARATLQVYG